MVPQPLCLELVTLPQQILKAFSVGTIADRLLFNIYSNLDTVLSTLYNYPI